jgi:hypothetical protein
MRDLSQIERELREYERKIQRLKQLERELNSLDTKGFENEVRSIKSKIKDPDRVNQVEREISALKQKIEPKERKRKEAGEVIDAAKSAIQKAKSFNLAVSDAERLLNEAKSLLGKGHKALLGKGDYATAIERANKSKGIAEAEMDKKFKRLRKEALNAINDAHSALQKAKKLGVNTKWSEEKLNNAKRKLDEKDFPNATKLAKECKSSLDEKINEYKEAAERSAKQSLDFAYSKIREAAKFSLTVPNAINLHEKAISEFDNREYEKAIEYAEKCKKDAEDEISKYNRTKEQIEASKDIVKSIKRLTPIPKAEELVEKAESALKVGNYNSAVKFAKEAEGEALRVKKDYEAYKETTDFIFSIESKITEIKNTGVKIPESEELIKQARSERNNNHLERAKELAREAKRIALERKEEYKRAFNSISSVKTTINSAKNSGVIISSVVDLLNKAKSSLDEGKYKEAFELSKQAEEEALRLKETYENYTETSDFISLIKSEITEIKNSGVKIPKSEELIGQAKSELNKNNFERAKELAEKAKRIAYERKSGYELAFRSISEAERILKETENKGVIISSDLLTKSKQAFDNGDYEESVRLSEELKNLVNNREIKYREARDRIKSAESAIEKTKEFGCDTSEAEEVLNRVRTGFDAGNYAQAISDAGESEKVAKEIKEKSKPEIEVNLSEKTFQPNVWEEISLNIFNKGNAHAKDIEIGLSEEVKVKGLEIIRSLNAGEKRDLDVSFKPVEVGRVPLEISTHFKDFDEKEYEEKNRVRIHVGEKRKESKEAQIEITIERAIYDPCKGDFIEKVLPRMKEWINHYDKGAYWFAISIQNNTDKEISDWDVEIKTSSALKIKEAKIEGIEERIPQESHLGIFKLSVSKAHGYTIPKGGQRRVYFKLRAEKPKTMYEIRGVFKSKITGDVPIRPKEFKYLCDARSLRGTILEHPEAALEYVKTQVDYYSPAEVSTVVRGLDIVFDICRMCESRYPKRADVRSEVEKLKGYLENVEDKLGRSYNDFEMLVREMDAVLFEETVPEKYAEKIKRKCLFFPDDLLAKLQRQSIERGG